jgi:protein arginine N-methyltransferase 7
MLPKRYLHRELPDTPRLAAWWAATVAAVAAVAESGRQPRVLLLGAKAGLLAVAAVRAGAVHVTCVEQ